MIGVYSAADDAGGLTTIGRKHDVEREEVDPVLVVRRHEEMTEVKRPRIQQIVVADLRPVLAIVGGVPQHPFLRFHQRINMLRVAGRHCQPNAPDRRLRQSGA